MAPVEHATPEEIIEGLADSVGLTTLDGKFLYVNAEFERSTGWSRREAVGRTAAELGILSESEFRSIGTEVVPRLQRDGFVRNIEKTAHRRDGSSTPVRTSWALVRSAEGEPTGLLLVVTDISEEKRAEAALRVSEERWRALVEDSADTVITTDLDGRIRFVNRPVAGIDPGDVVGADVVDCLRTHQAEGLREAMALVANTGKTRSLELQSVDVEGHHHWYSARVGAIRDRRAVVGLAIVCADITRRKRLERARDQFVERIIEGQDEERRRIARELHDETGQSLAALTIGLKTLELSVEQEALRARCRDLRELVETTAEDVRRLARGLHPSILDDLGFSAAMRRHVEDYAQAHGIEVELDLRGTEALDGLPRAIEIALYRVAQEALTNTARHSRASRVSVLVEHSGERVEMRVEDDGVGILSTRRRAGSDSGEVSGLGLIGIRERIALLDGSVVIDECDGGGTVVHVRVPLRRW